MTFYFFSWTPWKAMDPELGQLVAMVAWHTPKGAQ